MRRTTGDRYAFVPGTRPWGRHPLLEAAVEAAGVPPGMTVEIRLRSAMPPGASTGTSAAVCVALVGALRALDGQSLEPGAVASDAHAVEVERLGQQSGLQDQLAAAYGGVNYVEISSYPASTVRQLPVGGAVLAALEDRLLLVYLGRTHSSSAIHEQVIRDLTSAGARGQAALEALRDAAAAARDAVLAGDLGALGAAMRANTDAQRLLHPALVGVGRAAGHRRRAGPRRARLEGQRRRRRRRIDAHCCARPRPARAPRWSPPSRPRRRGLQVDSHLDRPARARGAQGGRRGRIEPMRPARVASRVAARRRRNDDPGPGGRCQLLHAGVTAPHGRPQPYSLLAGDYTLEVYVPKGDAGKSRSSAWKTTRCPTPCRFP